MSNVLKMLSRGGAAAAETDPNFNQTVLLLHGDGTNGAQNNTFLDSSTNNFTITRNGNTTQGTFSPFSVGAGEWSNYFDGNGDFLSITGNSNFDSTGDFTMEAWAYITSASAYGGIISLSEGVSGAGGRIAILNTGFIEFAVIGTGGSGGGFYAGTAVPLNQWFHVALVRSGSSTNNCSAYLNGNRVGQFTSTSQVNTASNVCVIGRYYASGTNQYWTTGYIASARYVVGTALYSGATYTVPTAPLTAISGTQLLTCQSNRFVDNSTNAFAITRNGDVRVTPFSPFAPTAAYSAGTNGGSGYFDGSGDYLTVPDNAALELGSSNFTVEAWVYLAALPAASNRIVEKGTAAPDISYLMGINSSGQFFFSFSENGTDQVTIVTSASTIVANQWYHLAATRSGSTFTIWVNGVSSGTATSSLTIKDSTSTLRIANNFNNDRFLNGYISNLRIVKGTAVYTAAFTPPTAPLTAITNTSLLLNFTNAGIIDNTGKNNLETVGNAQIDTTTKKYGTGSLEFDGSGDVLVIPTSPNLDFGTGNFTIELWANFSALTTNRMLVDRWASGNANTWQVYWRATGTSIVFYNGTSVLLQDPSTTRITTGVWYHIAVTRSGSTNKLFINGTEVASATDSTNFTNTLPLAIGQQFSTATNNFNGYIDDLRITKGVARYTANFTAPTKEFPDL